MPHECVRELVALAVRRDQHPRSERLVDAVEQGILFEIRQHRECVKPKRPAERRREGEHTCCLRRESREPVADRLADTLGDGDLAQWGAGGHELQRDLADEEGIASGLTRHRLRGLPRHGTVGVRCEQRPDLHRIKDVKPYATDPHLPVEVRQRLGERMDQLELGLAVCPNEDDRCGGQDAADVAQQAERRGVGPMKVVEHDHDPLVRKRDDQLGECLVSPKPCLVASQRSRPARLLVASGRRSGRPAQARPQLGPKRASRSTSRSAGDTAWTHGPNGADDSPS